MISFRDLVFEDLEMVRTWRNSKEVSEHMYTDYIITYESQVEWFNSLSANKKVKYLIVCSKEVPIGMVYLTNIDSISKHCEWGLYIGEPKYRLRGAGAIAAYKLINHAFFDLGMNKIMSFVLTTNTDSLKLTESLGMERFAYLKDHCFKQGRYIDMIGYNITRTNWIKLNEYFKTKFK